MQLETLLKSIIFCVCFTVAVSVQSQVGIGTTSVNASAKLQVDATTQGFLPPRVALASTATAANTISSPATGLLVYNTATAGSGATAVTPGFYYYDGSKWQRIINQQPDATVSFDGTNPNTGMGATNFSGTQQSTDFIYVSNTNNSQWTWNGTAYVTYTPPASTPWFLSGGTTDAGSNKADAVYRTGSVGIGSTTTPNASAQLDVNSTSKGFLPPRMTSAQRGAIASPSSGLMVYQTDGTAGLYFYNGSAWVYIINATGSTLPIANGGTGQTTANAALNALLPSQTGNANKVLVTDGTSTAWNTNVALTSTVLGTMGSGAANTTQNSYTGASITLPNGKWSVSVAMLAVTSSSGDYWLRTGFSASSSSISLGTDAVAGGPSLVSGFVHGGGLYTMLTGTIIINNTSGANKTYYYCTGGTGVWNGGTTAATFINLGRDAYGENCIVAYPMN